jgi:hypothetical protein
LEVTNCDLKRALIPHPEGRAVLRPRLAPVVKPRRGDVRMAEPFLDLGDVGFVRERVGGGGGAQRMHAEAVDFGADAPLQAVFARDVAVGRGGFEGPLEFFLGPVVSYGPVGCMLWGCRESKRKFRLS